MYDNIKTGMTVKVHEKIKEKTEKGEKERIQIFEGIVISRHGGKQPEATIMVRKIGADGVGVEKIFPLNMPSIAKIEPVRLAKVRQSKLYYMRDYRKRLKETAITA